MYFAYGWPKAFSVAEPTETDNSSTEHAIIFLEVDADTLVLVTSSTIQLWTGGQHRVRLGSLSRAEDSLLTEGLNKRAYWSSSRRLLAVVTTNNILHVYGLHTAKESVVQVPQWEAAHDFKRTDLYLQNSLPACDDAAVTCNDIVGDSRSVLLGMSDGSLHLFSWQGKLRGILEPSSLFDDKKRHMLRRQSSSGYAPHWSSYSPHGASGLQSQFSAGFSASGSPGAQGGSLFSSYNTFRADSGDWGGAIAGAPPAGVRCLDYVLQLRLLAVVLADGRVALCRTPQAGLFPTDQIQLSHFVCRAGSGAVATRIGSMAQLVAVGLESGDVALYRLYGWGAKARRATADGAAEPLRVLSLLDWGYGPEILGPVADLRWSPNNRGLAVGWEWRGMAVWSPSGCRLMTSLRQAGRDATTPRTARELLSPFNSSLPDATLPLETGISALAWGSQGYQLLLAESHRAGQVLEIAFAKSLTGSHRVVHAHTSPCGALMKQEEEVHVLQAEDRLLLIMEQAEGGEGPTSQFRADGAGGAGSSGSDLVVHHLRVPQQYIGVNAPLLHTAVSANGLDIAVAGRRGLALYSRRSGRWRLFGDVSQEKDIHVKAVLWLPRVVVACTAKVEGGAWPHPDAAAQLLLYPRYHLDNHSLLASYPLSKVPLAMDSLGQYLVVVSAPLEIKLIRVQLEGALTPQGSPSARLTVVRELSIMSVGQPLSDVALVEPSWGEGAGPGGEEGGADPRHCVLLRAGGHMSVLDMDQGSEITLADDVESFWISGPRPSSSQWQAGGQPLTPRREGSFGAEAIAQIAPLDRSGSLHSCTSSVQSLPDATAASLRQSASSDALLGTASNGGHSQHGWRLPLLDIGDGGASTTAADDAAEGTPAYGSVEMPWWTYGARGMQLWFPSSLAEPLSPSTRAAWSPDASTDPELEFDREVYPIGISLAEVAIIGVTQRTVRSAARGPGPPLWPGAQAAGFGHGSYPCFWPMAESQPVLPCLLRRLLQKGKADDALALAKRHSSAPQFARSLEWLLFTSLEADADAEGSHSKRPASPSDSVSTGSGQAASAGQQKARAGPLLQAAAELIRQFPEFADVVVSVARKTDAALWPALFAAIGSPAAILEGQLARGTLQSAACCLLIVDCLEGAPLAHALALRLIKAALAVGQYELAADLLRFLIPPGELESTAFAEAVTEASTSAAANGQSEEVVEALAASEAAPEQEQQPPLRKRPPSPSQQQQHGGSGGWLAALLWGAHRPPDATPAGPSSAEEPKQPVAVAPQANGGGTEAEQQEEEGHSAGLDAWRIMARHAAQLLDSGCLRPLARLGRALGLVGGGLPALLLSARRQQPQPTPRSPAAKGTTILSALSMAAAELAVQAEEEAVMDAQLLLQSCRAASATTWAAALAVLLEDLSLLAEAKEAEPQLWAQFSEAVRQDAQFSMFWDLVREVDGSDGYFANRTVDYPKGRAGMAVPAVHTRMLGLVPCSSSPTAPAPARPQELLRPRFSGLAVSGSNLTACSTAADRRTATAGRCSAEANQKAAWEPAFSGRTGAAGSAGASQGKVQRGQILSTHAQATEAVAPIEPLPEAAEALKQWAEAEKVAVLEEEAAKEEWAPPSGKDREVISRTVYAVILAGGPSSNPLSVHRANPALDLGANLQLIDVPISNCIQSGINKMYVLTQFNSHTLNTHITNCYPASVFGGPHKRGFVDVLAATQTPNSTSWYRGSADAVRQNLDMITSPYQGTDQPNDLLLLSGQALYRMDYAELVQTHRNRGADITIVTHSAAQEEAKKRGLARLDPKTDEVREFTEKPSGGNALQRMAHASRHATAEKPFEASIGVYLFKREVLVQLLNENEKRFGTDSGPDTHFGYDVIPHALRSGYKVVSHHYDGFWQDVSTLREFFEVNLALTQSTSPISIYDVDEAIMSRGQCLPPAMFTESDVEESLIGEGSVIRKSKLKNVVVGCNTFIAENCDISDSLLMGYDTYENDRAREACRAGGQPCVLGIGENTIIRNAIVDKNAAIGRNVRITNEGGIKEADFTSSKGYLISDGIVVVMKGAYIPDNTVI